MPVQGDAVLGQDISGTNGSKASLGAAQDLETTDCAEAQATAAPLRPLAAGGRGCAGIDVGAVWQMSSMCLGIGIFALPYSFLKLGVVHGTVWIIVMGLFANAALQRLLDLAAEYGSVSYEELAERAFGKAGKLAMTIITLVTTGIATLSYLGAARSLLVGVAVAFFTDFDVNSVPGGVTVLGKAKDCTMLLVLCIAVLPKCLSRSMGANAWISSGGVAAMCISSAFFVYSCARVLVLGCDDKDVCGGRPPAFAGNVADTLQYVATLAFSFSMVFALFPVLEERTGSGVAEGALRLKSAVRASVTLSCVVYLLVGIGGALAFGTGTQPLALQNLPLSQPLAQVITLVVGVSVSLLVAIIAFPTLQSLERLVGRCFQGGEAPESLRPWLVAGVGAVCVLVDAYLPTKIAFALTGSLGLALGAYVMPCLLCLRLGAGAGTCQRAVTLLVLLFGCVLLFGSTPVTVMRLVQGDSGPAPKTLSELICQHPQNFASLSQQVVV